MSRIAIIGGGAAGAFCGALLRELAPSESVTIFEAGARPMAKLAVTGGGRCNFTNSFEGIKSLQEAYPRGAVLMKRALKAFGSDDIREWFRSRGVPSVLQEDHCVFPRSQNAMDIVGALAGALQGCHVKTRTRVSKILEDNTLLLTDNSRERFDAVVVTTGGGSKSFLDSCPVEMVEGVPSLYSFMVDSPLKALAGTVSEATVSMFGKKAAGALLLTDWGMSGPAILKLSSYAARELAENQWRGSLSVNWTGLSEQDCREMLQRLLLANPRKMLSRIHPEGLTSRLWEQLTLVLRPSIRCEEVGKSGLNKLTDKLINDRYFVSGRNPWKEEFVTCGGVSLSGVDLGTLECKRRKGLYFAGEVLDIDGITGGFNLQAAWSTAYLVAKAIARR
ncbi:MAG: aminoacetone oxidase family FAD-binding enzyme [Bacteroidales bacterium]|nr:aminoacetone oxidase family FAD-binding enzyme [Bacteroidales bacterium]